MGLPRSPCSIANHHKDSEATNASDTSTVQLEIRPQVPVPHLSFSVLLLHGPLRSCKSPGLPLCHPPGELCLLEADVSGVAPATSRSLPAFAGKWAAECRCSPTPRRSFQSQAAHRPQRRTRPQKRTGRPTWLNLLRLRLSREEGLAGGRTELGNRRQGTVARATRPPLALT